MGNEDSGKEVARYYDKEVARYYDDVIERGYHDNTKYLSDLSKIIGKKDKVLEIGCGTGKILLGLLKKGVLIEGLDVSKSMIEKLKSKNKKAVVYISNLNNFSQKKKYDYIISCNGPFSIKGDEIETYILYKDKLIEILKKYTKMAKKGLLINKGIEKPELKIPLKNNEIFVHKESRVNDFVIMTNLLFKKEKFNGIKTFIKRRYKIKEVLKDNKIEDLGNFKLIKK